MLTYKYENGRRYNAFREGSYILPNDDQEQERMDMLHHIYRLILGGSLWRAPIISEDRPSPKRILDLGCGTGAWCMEVADELSEALVEGIDLSPIQPNWVPPNCQFYVDDFEAQWTYKPDEKFDYIHGRALAACVADWPKLFGQMYENLNEGGYVEFQECKSCPEVDLKGTRLSGGGIHSEHGGSRMGLSYLLIPSALCRLVYVVNKFGS